MSAFTWEERDQIQGLIDNGMAWKLEGSVGRVCMDAINAGACTLGETGHWGAYGQYIPSKHEVEPGTKGSVEYCEDRNWGEEE